MYSKKKETNFDLNAEIIIFNKNVISLIHEFEKKNILVPKARRSNLADLTGICRMALYRIKTGKIKATDTSLTNIVKLLTFLTKKDFSDLYNFNKKIYDHVWKTDLSILLQNSAEKPRQQTQTSIDLERSKKENTDKMARLLEDPDTLAIYAISKRKEGVSFETLKSLMGDKFLDKAYLLADAKAINIDFKEEKIFSQEMLYVSYSRENLKSMIPSHIKHYDHKRSGTDSNFIGLRSNCINKETLSEIVRICEIAQTKINALVENRENYGDIPFFSTIVVDRFIHKIEE